MNCVLDFYLAIVTALAGYWGGISEDEEDDMPRELNSINNPVSSSLLLNFTNFTNFISAASKTMMTGLPTSNKKGNNVTPMSKTSSGSGSGVNTFVIGKNTRLPVSLKANPTISTMKPKLKPLVRDKAIPSDSTKVVRRSYSTPTPHLLLVEPALSWDPSALAGVGSVALDKLEEMYYRMYSYLRDSGIDGVKVDAQSGIGSFGLGNGGGANIARACVSAMEKNVRFFFGNDSVLLNNLVNISNAAVDSINGTTTSSTSSLNTNKYWRYLPSFRSVRNRFSFPATDSILTKNELISHSDPPPELPFSPLSLVGCMCHSTENLFNFYETSLARVSDDFYPKDKASQTVHLVSCAYNSVMIGEIAIADWYVLEYLPSY